MSSNQNYRDPKSILLKKVKDLHDQYFMLDGDFPINMEMLASIAGVSVQKTIMSEGASGQLIPKNNKLIALINELDPPTRQNFTIGHEIAHTFFPNYKKRKFRAESVNKIWGDNISIDNEEEYLCDFAASELLIPTEKFKEKLNELSLSVESIPELSRFFGASYEAVAIKMTNVADFPCAILVSEKGFKQSEKEELENRKIQPSLFELSPIEEKLRVKFLSRSSLWHSKYLPKDVSIPGESSIYEAAKKAELTRSSNEHLDFKKFQGTYKIETLPLTSTLGKDGSSRKTFSLLRYVN